MKSKPKKKMKSIFKVEHPYYFHFHGMPTTAGIYEYDTWADFFKEHHDSDSDLNLLIRWDIFEPDEESGFPTKWMEMLVYQQRLARLVMVRVRQIDLSDEDSITKWLRPRWKTMAAIWSPFSKEEV